MGRKLIHLVGIVVLCLLALVVGVVAALGPERAMALLSGRDDPAPAADHASEEVPAADHGAPPGGHAAPSGGHDAPAGHGAGGKEKIVVTPFKEIIVNIRATTATGRETTRFLKLNLALVYDESRHGAAEIEPRKLFIRDSFQEYLRQLNEADLQGSVGLVNLKSELLRRARAITDSEAPQEILIADLIVQ